MLGQTTRILAAVAADSVARVRRILNRHDLVIVHDSEHAKNEWDRGVRLVFVSARFDDSHMYEFLDYLRTHVHRQRIPVVAAIVMPTNLSAVAIQGMDLSTKLYGASVFVNFNEFQDDDIGNSRLRLIVEALIIPEDVMPVVEQVLQRPKAYPAGTVASGNRCATSSRRRSARSALKPK